MSGRAGQAEAAAPDLWRALASPWRRRLLDLLRDAPATTGALASQLPELSRFAVMQHLGVLADAGVVVIERRGRDRVNHLNPVPLREWYERWVQPMADTGAASLLALKRAAETGESDMSEPADQVRTVRLAFELRIEASAQRTFEVMTQQWLDWFPVTYGGDRVRRVVLEPRVGGQHTRTGGMAAATSTGRSRSTTRRCAGPPAGESCPARSSTPTTGCARKQARPWSA